MGITSYGDAFSDGLWYVLCGGRNQLQGAADIEVTALAVSQVSASSQGELM